MSLIARLAQEITEEEMCDGESQCFIGHEFRNRDLRVKLERSLEQLGLQAYFADKEVTGEFILVKVCRKILVTRASIVNLTTANPNVYFELGLAIGLNKPIFVTLKRSAVVPPLLESFVKLRFSSYIDLERELVKQVSNWLEKSIEYHLLHDTHCEFTNFRCPDRLKTIPSFNYLIIDHIENTGNSSQHTLTYDRDVRAELLVALDRFPFTPTFLSDLPMQNTPRLCDYCRAIRKSMFTLCHLTHRTSPSVYLLLGLAIGLGIPSLLVVHKERDRNQQVLFEIPTMLRGLDVFSYEHSVEIGERMGCEVEGFLNQAENQLLDRKDNVFWRNRITSAHNLSDPEEKAAIMVNIISRLTELDDPVGIHKTLMAAQSIADIRHKIQVTISAAKAFAKLRNIRGINEVVKLGISANDPNFQAPVLSSASQAYRSIGRLQKASEVNAKLNRLLIGRKGGRRDFFGAVVKRLETLQFDYMIVGSLACNLYGTSRAAMDIDLVIQLKPERVSQFRQAFPSPRFYVPSRESIDQAILERGIFNIIEVDTGLKADFHILQDRPQSQREFSRRRRHRFIGRLYASYSTPEDLILNKMEYFERGGVAKHLRDIRDIVRTSNLQIDFGYIEWAARELKIDALWEEISQKWL